MKINPIGINAYQQINRSGNATQTNKTGGTPETNTNLRIQPQNPQLPSKVSTKPQINDSNTIMTAAERSALESLIKVVHEKGNMNVGYARDNRTVDNPNAVGNLVDVKV